MVGEESCRCCWRSLRSLVDKEILKALERSSEVWKQSCSSVRLVESGRSYVTSIDKQSPHAVAIRVRCHQLT